MTWCRKCNTAAARWVTALVTRSGKDSAAHGRRPRKLSRCVDAVCKSAHESAEVPSESALPVMGVVSAIAISSSIVDASPLSTNGALLLANQKTMDERVFFRQLLLYAIVIVAAAPLLTWLVFVVLQVP